MNIKLKDVAEIKFCLVNTSKDKSRKETKWLTPANLLDDNIINGFTMDNRYTADESVRVGKEDIIVKRISPSFVNFIDVIEDGVYASNNLILIKPKKDVNPKYLSFIMNDNIKGIANACIGATIPAIGRTELENLSIPLLPLEKQIALGEIWHDNIKLKKLKKRLVELDEIKNKYSIDNYMRIQIGGRRNGI
jgi:restriction endonuclease S subunit